MQSPPAAHPNPPTPPQNCRRSCCGSYATAWGYDNTHACSDGSACTYGDRCVNGSCTGTGYACNDGLTCTSDACNGAGGCTYSLIAGNCLIGGACYVNGQLNASAAVAKTLRLADNIPVLQCDLRDQASVVAVLERAVELIEE